jgi:hypothetical protein
MKVSWDYYSPIYAKIKLMFQTTNQKGIEADLDEGISSLNHWS